MKNRDFVGAVFALIAAVFYAMIPNLGRFLKEVKSDIVTFVQLFISSVILIPFVLYGKIFVGKINWFAVGILVAVHTVFALFLYRDGLKSVSFYCQNSDRRSSDIINIPIKAEIGERAIARLLY